MGRRSLWLEVGLVTFVVFLIYRIATTLTFIPYYPEIHTLIYLALFIYVPLIIMRHQRRQIVLINNRSSLLLRDFRIYLLWSGVIFIPFFGAAWLWMNVVHGMTSFQMPSLPTWQMVATQLLIIALPEEIFFRGYVQDVLNRAYEKKWRLFGTSLGMGWLLTALLFAFCHSLIMVQWWHFAIFFPALVFGYLRERTDALMVPILFHATSNLVLDWIVRGFH